MSKNKHIEAAVQAMPVPEASPPVVVAVVAPEPAPAPVVVEAPAVHAAAAVTDPSAAPAAPAAPTPVAASVTSALYGFGVTWAQKGIGLGKTALEGLARALDRTAKMLGDLQTQIKVSAEKPAV